MLIHNLGKDTKYSSRNQNLKSRTWRVAFPRWNMVDMIDRMLNRITPTLIIRRWSLDYQECQAQLVNALIV